jgi:hypothetical protein
MYLDMQGDHSSPGWTAATKIGLWGALSVFLVAMAALSLLTHSKPASFGELSRLAAVESLVERHTWAITGSGKTNKTEDKVLWRGEFYSDKTPLFIAMTAVPYYLFYRLLGAEIDSGSCNEKDPVCSYWWFSYLLVGLPAALMLALFYYLGRQLAFGAWETLMATIALGLGTMILPYSTTYNPHVPGAAYLFIGLVGLVWPRLSGKKQYLTLFGSGFLIGLAFAIDLPAFFLMVALAGVALIRQWRRFLWFAAGMLIPIVLTMAFNYQIHQSVLPIYLRPGAYAWEGSPWAEGIAGMQTPTVEDWDQRAFNTLVGHHGLLVTWPVMIFPLLGLWQQLKKGAPYQIEAWGILFGILLLLGNFLFVIDGFGGRSYGLRYLIALLPLLFFFIYFATPLSRSGGSNFRGIRHALTPNGAARGRASALMLALLSPGYWTVFVLLFVFSCLSTFGAVEEPWGKWQPIFFLETTEVKPYLKWVTPFPERPAHRLEAEIGPGMSLLGYSLTPYKNNPGDKVSLTLFWRPAQIPPSAKVFTHLRDADNQTVAQADHWLLGYNLSVEDWQQTLAIDPIVRDNIIFALPEDLPAGQYHIFVGLYTPETLERLPVVNDQSGENAIYIGDVIAK